MEKQTLSKLLEDNAGKRWGILANQTAYDPVRGRYTFQILADMAERLKVFLPEHGLFAELQDQIGLEDTRAYEGFLSEEARAHTRFQSLYGFQESTLRPDPAALADLDWLLVDLQDVGSRYYTFLTTMFYCLEVIQELRAAGKRIRCAVLDRPNPIGGTIEGTILEREYESFVGLPGVIHRHGLSSGEMARLFAQWLAMEDALVVLPWDQAGGELPKKDYGKEPGWKNEKSLPSQPGERGARHFGEPDAGQKRESGIHFDVYPSPNMPTIETARVYPGQCLLEGTSLSEGRGTTRPFEIFGAPYLAPLVAEASDFFLPGARLRPLRFLPTFHKHANEICEGFQLHITGDDFAPLFATLRILRWIRANVPEFQWKTGVYEFRSDRPAIELLAGDSLLLEYLQRSPAPKTDRLDDADRALLERMSAEEGRWMEIISAVSEYSHHYSSSTRLLQTYA